MFAAVILLPCIRIRQSKISTQINDETIVRKLGDQRAGLSVGQGEKNNVSFTQGVRIGCDKVLARQRDEVGVDVSHDHAGMPSSGNRTNAEIRM
jgi:hypothetical protein